MKKIALTILMTGIIQFSFCQNSLVNQVFSKYSGSEGFTVVNITGDLLKLAAQLDEKEDGDLEKLSKLKEIKILVQEDPVDGQRVDFHEEVYNKLDKSLYKELVVVKEADQDVNILARDENGKINEFLVIISGKDESVLIQVVGSIELSEIAEMGDFQIDGFDKLKMIKKNKQSL